jgi:hypothetical protein
VRFLPTRRILLLPNEVTKLPAGLDDAGGSPIDLIGRFHCVPTFPALKAQAGTAHADLERFGTKHTVIFFLAGRTFHRQLKGNTIAGGETTPVAFVNRLREESFPLYDQGEMARGRQDGLPSVR